MCEPVTLTAMAIGAGIGATTAAITGQDPLMGALMGAAAGAFAPAGFGVTAGSAGGFAGMAGSAAGPTSLTGMGANIALSGVGTALGVSLAGGMLMNSMRPPQVGYTPAAQVSQQQQLRALNMNTNIATTGSGGRQAATSLAAAISRTKKRKLTQDDVGDLSLSTESFTNTGLQLA